MKKYLSPSMLSADFTKLGEQLQTIENAGNRMLHVDVMDGLFVPSISFGMPVIESIRPSSKMIFDVHMMVIDPERYIEDIRKSGAEIISFHVEACKCIVDTLKKIKELGAKPALAINPETPMETLRPYLQYCEEVVVMSVHPGFGGQSFIEASFDRIKELSNMRAEMGLDFAIEVDGGIKLSNVEDVLKCGADIIVAGSAVFKDDIAENVRQFKEIISKYED